MDNSPIVIRPATNDDLAPMSALWYEKAVMLSQQDRRWRLGEQGRADWERQAAGWLRDEKCGVRVAQDGDAIVGYAIGWIQSAPPGMAFESFGMVSDLAIDAHTYHGGTARSLVLALRVWFASRGVWQMVASVPKRDAIGQAFWRAYGAAEWMEWLWIKS
jgi:hypothetical protein